ncbi:tetratricopeptide (TPR) repeat protein [Gracilibacillus halotolerans]|uniref:Tetratricopeptide (TPR) repeat protein n=1 Tax=Gracilibacillus halotolerans TaxID=74386 RepID=A0A841RLT2_9BACI|nr:tetratricopeptide (TPR) repeat protein [Gracilibacillus halotolerans]
MSKQNQRENKIIPFIPEGDFYFSKGIEAFKKRKFDLSLKWLHKAMEENPKNPLYMCQASVVHTETGAYHLANQLLTRVLSNDGDHYVDCYYLLANNYAHLGLLQDAVKYATLYLEKAPDGDFSEDAEDLLDILDFTEIEDEEEDWMMDEEDDLLIYQESVFYHLERQEWEEALVLLEEMIALYPDFIQAHHEYRYALFFHGDRQRAIELETNHFIENPKSLYSLMNLVIFHKYEQNIKEMTDYLNMLQNIYPLVEQQKLKMAITFAQAGSYEEAWNRFKVLRKSQVKGHPSFYKWYSMTAYILNKQDLAQELWKEGCRQHRHVLKQDLPPWTDIVNQTK